jgi:ABC-2 type transport system ATP-binding protein
MARRRGRKMEGTKNGLSIVIEGVRHVYKGGTVALDGIELSIGTGLFGLLGPNGAGKSTLMRIICTLLVPTEGRVSVGGYDVIEERRDVRRLFGYLPQEFNAWRLHRVEEVLDCLASLSGLNDKNSRRERVLEVLDSVGLQDVADRKVKKLSGGMVRRLGVAQALIHDPRILVVDEPTVGLDPEERLHFRQLMTRLGQDRIILLSTHIVADLGSGCSDMALIDHGRVEFRGSPAELMKRAKESVFEITVDHQDESRIMADLEIVSRDYNQHGVTIRAVSGGGNLPEGARPVENPTLEEAYLAFMASRGRIGDEFELEKEVTT